MQSVALFALLFATPIAAEIILRRPGGLMNPGYVRPKCARKEACNFSYKSEMYGFCDCDGSHARCQRHNEVTFGPVSYSFCQPTEFEVCEDGEVALEIVGLQTMVHCLCPESTNNFVRTGSQFLCLKKDLSDYSK